MNKTKLKKEGKKWVKDGIITDEQLEAILSKYVKRDQSYLLVLFAVLLMSIGILIFVFSDWAQVPNLTRLSVIVIFMLILYVAGSYFYSRNLNLRKNTELSNSKSFDYDSNRHFQIYGISFILLGYILFGAILFLIINMYQVNLFNVWPFIIWSIVGLLLYSVYEVYSLFVIALLITVFGQLYSALAFSSFNLIIFFIFVFGYFYFVLRRNNPFYNYVFAIGLAIQILVATIVALEQYYWFIFLTLLLYILGKIIPKTALRNSLIYVSLLSIFIFKMYESFLVQEEYFVNDLVIEPGFFIGLGIVWIGAFIYEWRWNKSELINLLLFIPFFFIPYSYIFIILSMFLFAIYWLIIGFQSNRDDKTIIGIISFLISTFTVYIQFAWETLNKSLFFLLGGILLFVISFILEKQRRKTEGRVGGHKK